MIYDLEEMLFLLALKETQTLRRTELSKELNHYENENFAFESIVRAHS